MAPQAAPAPPPHAAAPLPELPFDKDVFYRILEAEFALKRQLHDIAAQDFLRLARETRDPRLAERAAQVAIFARDDQNALAAVELWLELDPDNVEAQRMLVVASIRNGRHEAAVAQLEALLAAQGAAPENGLRIIAGLLSREQDIQTALAVMERFVTGHRNDPEVLFAYSHVALRAAALDTALAAVDGALRLRPDWVDAIALRVRILQIRGEADQAAEYLAGAVRTYKEDLTLRLMYARMLMEARRYEEAIPHYEKLARQTEDNADILFTLGLLNLQIKRLDEARRYFTSTEVMQRRYDDVHFYLGLLEENRNDREAAVAHYAAVGPGENYVEARIRLTILYAAGDKLAEARDLLHALATQFPGQQKRLDLVEGEIVRDAGLLDEALAVYTAALARFPGDDELLYARALLAERMDRLDITERDLRAIIARDPDHAEALNALGYTLADRTDRYEEAYRYIKRALQLKPTSGAVLDSMGWVLYRLGNYQEAIRYLRRSLEITEDHEIAAHLGEVLWVSGAQQEALEVWQQALKRFPGEKILLDVMKRFGQQ